MALNPWWQTSSIAFSRLKSHPRVFWFQMINDQAQPTWTIRTHRLSRESDSFSLFVATRRVWKHFEIGKVISRLEASSGDTGGWFKWDFAFLVLNNCQVLFCCNHKHLILRCFKLLWFNRMPFYDLYCIHNKIDCEIRVYAFLICLTDFFTITWPIWSLEKGWKYRDQNLYFGILGSTRCTMRIVFCLDVFWLATC